MAGDAEGAGDLLVRVVRSDQADDLGLSGSESQAARNGPGIRDGCARRGRLDHETSLGPMAGARYTQTEGTCGRDGSNRGVRSEGPIGGSRSLSQRLRRAPASEGGPARTGWRRPDDQLKRVGIPAERLVR